MRTVFPILAALGLLAVGTDAILRPQQAATTYGLPTSDTNGLGFVRGCGARDIIFGLLLLSARNRARGPLALISLIGLSDFLAVALASEAPPVKSLAIHGSGTVGLLVLALISK